MSVTAEDLLKQLEGEQKPAFNSGMGDRNPFSISRQKKSEAELMLEQFEGEKPRSEQSFSERFGEDLKVRFGEQGAEIINRRVAEDQDFASTVLQLTGKVGAGSILDFLGEAIISGGRGLSAITPDAIEDPLVENATKAGLLFLNTDIAQRGLDAAKRGIAFYQEFKEEHPTAAANIEAVVNIGLLLAPAKGTPKSEAGAIGRAGQATVRSAGRSQVRSKGAFIKELVTPKQTQKVRAEQVARTAESGILRKKEIALSPLQQRSADAIRKVPGINPNRTLQHNYNAIAAQVTKRANSLERQLSSLGDRGRYIWNEFGDDIANKVTQRLKENPALVGDAQRSAQRVIEKALNLSVKEEKTLAGLLRVRRDLDRWVIKHKPKAFDDGVSANAMTSAAREVRASINEFIAVRAGGVRVRHSLRDQSAMLRAMDDIAIKAANEADSIIARAFQRAVKIIPIRNELVAAGSLIFGMGGLGAAAAFAPAISKAIATAGILYGTKRAIMSPSTRRGIGELMKALDRAITKTTDPFVIQQLRLDKAALSELTKEVKEQTEED